MDKVILDSKYVDVKIKDAMLVVEISPLAALEALAASTEAKLDDKIVAALRALLDKQTA